MESLINLQKKELRRSVIKKRNELSLSKRDSKSSCICDELIQLTQRVFSDNFSRIGTHPLPSLRIGLYSAFPHEVQLHDYAVFLYQLKAQVYFPCMNKPADKFEIEHHLIHYPMTMRTVSYEDYLDKKAPFVTHPLLAFSQSDSAMEPFTPANPQELDMLVVPLVGFDKCHRRLGYGGGNYDRYIPLLRPDCFVVGVAFSEQECEEIPVDVFDRKLPYIIHA